MARSRELDPNADGFAANPPNVSRAIERAMAAYPRAGSEVMPFEEAIQNVAFAKLFRDAMVLSTETGASAAKRAKVDDAERTREIAALRAAMANPDGDNYVARTHGQPRPYAQAFELMASGTPDGEISHAIGKSTWSSMRTVARALFLYGALATGRRPPDPFLRSIAKTLRVGSDAAPEHLWQLAQLEGLGLITNAEANRQIRLRPAAWTRLYTEAMDKTVAKDGTPARQKDAAVSD